MWKEIELAYAVGANPYETSCLSAFESTIVCLHLETHLIITNLIFYQYQGKKSRIAMLAINLSVARKMDDKQLDRAINSNPPTIKIILFRFFHFSFSFTLSLFIE